MIMRIGFLGIVLSWGALLALLTGGAALIFRQVTGTRVLGGREQPTARQILDVRLASGEISQKEYDSIRARVEYVKVKEGTKWLRKNLWYPCRA